MIIRNKRTALILASSVGLSTFALAGSNNKPATASTESKWDGEVTAVESSLGELTVKALAPSKPAEKTFAVGAQTSIRAHGKALHLSDLKTGDKVTVHYKDSGGKLSARSIDVKHS